MLHPQSTMSVSKEEGRREWSSHGFDQVFNSRERLLDPDHWRTFYDVLRFNATARRVIMKKNRPFIDERLTIGEYIAKEGYSDAFVSNYLKVSNSAVFH